VSTTTEASVRGDTLVYWIVEDDTNEWRTEGLIKLAAIQHLRVQRTRHGHGPGAPERLLVELHLGGNADVVHLWFDEPTAETEECSNAYDLASKLWSVLTETIQANDRPVEG
jgi:hypothetical protein